VSDDRTPDSSFPCIFKMEKNDKTPAVPNWSGYRAVLGSSEKGLAIFRIMTGFLLALELLLRYRFLHVFYSDEGTFPTSLLTPQVDNLYRCICIHAFSGSMIYQQFLLTLQLILAVSLMVGYRTRLVCCLSWYLYLSITLRNTWLNFILDRYFHYMLFYAMFLPTANVLSVDSLLRKKMHHESGRFYGSDQVIVSLATICVKAQILWIYLDAGQGKYNDPLGGWSLNADPIPALDSYARHTVIARYLYAFATPVGLRLMTPSVVYIELLTAPIALIGSYFGNRRLVLSAIILICSLHAGIAMTVRNTFLLSSIACAAWAVFLPPPSISSSMKLSAANTPTSASSKRSSIYSTIVIVPMIFGSVWFETISGECNQSMKHIWSTLLHNRWNVFIGAEEYVTWEIAPGRLQNGSVVDVWGRKVNVDWQMPGSGAPSTSTARPGRWRSFPYLAELDGEEGDALWSYLCRQWDTENCVDKGNEGKKLLRYNFFMLQADVLPDMEFSPTRKRLIHSHDCTKKSNFVKHIIQTETSNFDQDAEL